MQGSFHNSLGQDKLHLKPLLLSIHAIMFSRRINCLLFLICTKCVHLLTNPCYEPSGTAWLQLGDHIAAWYSHVLYPTTPPTPMLRPCTADHTTHLERPHFQDFAIALTESAIRLASGYPKRALMKKLCRSRQEQALVLLRISQLYKYHDGLKPIFLSSPLFSKLLSTLLILSLYSLVHL